MGMVWLTLEIDAADISQSIHQALSEQKAPHQILVIPGCAHHHCHRGSIHCDLQGLLTGHQIPYEVTLIVNLLSSPGAGKTSLLEATARYWQGRRRMAILVGDLETDRDARRLAPLAPTRQLTTGGACHLELPLVRSGLDTRLCNPPRWRMRPWEKAWCREAPSSRRTYSDSPPNPRWANSVLA